MAPQKDAKAAFRSSIAWRRTRYGVLAANAARHGGVAQCELCGARAAPGAPLHCDHVEAVSKNWARRLDPTNLQGPVPGLQRRETGRAGAGFSDAADHALTAAPFPIVPACAPMCIRVHLRRYLRHARKTLAYRASIHHIRCMKPVCIALDDATLAALARTAETDGRSRSDVVRRVLARAFADDADLRAMAARRFDALTNPAAGRLLSDRRPGGEGGVVPDLATDPPRRRRGTVRSLCAPGRQNFHP